MGQTEIGLSLHRAGLRVFKYRQRGPVVVQAARDVRLVAGMRQMAAPQADVHAARFGIAAEAQPESERLLQTARGAP